MNVNLELLCCFLVFIQQNLVPTFKNVKLLKKAEKIDKWHFTFVFYTLSLKSTKYEIQIALLKSNKRRLRLYILQSLRGCAYRIALVSHATEAIGWFKRCAFCLRPRQNTEKKQSTFGFLEQLLGNLQQIRY